MVIFAILYTVLTVHLGVVLASLYMHRYMIHKQYSMSPRLEKSMKVLYWLLFDTIPREFIVQHRKHHEFSDSVVDPHSPRFGFWSLLRNCLVPSFFRSYRIEVSDLDYSRYGGSVSNSFVDRHPRLGPLLFLSLTVTLFGWWGILIWLAHLFLVNFLTITTITVFGHVTGYRNFNTNDLTTNIVPIGILCVGEEMHNNHHKDSKQCNFAVKKNEFDLGYQYLRILNKFNLIQFKKEL